MQIAIEFFAPQDGRCFRREFQRHQELMGDKDALESNPGS
jgi:hypothetical protein